VRRRQERSLLTANEANRNQEKEAKLLHRPTTNESDHHNAPYMKKLHSAGH
jgi:hypothetical protein